MLEVGNAQGKGRGIFASRLIKAGELVLREHPLLLYPQPSTAAAFCSHCLRAFSSLGADAVEAVPCSSCGRVGFCNPACAAAAAADSGSHCAAVCGLLKACNLAGLTDDQQAALELLARCCSLRLAAAAGDEAAAGRCAAIASLATPPRLLSEESSDAALASTSSVTSDVVMAELHGRLSHALAAVGASPPAALSLSEVEEVLRKEGSNGYGIMAPSAADGERRIRGTALYAQASLINHDCLPNLARFDNFDGPADGAMSSANTAVEFRALHDIPAGEELTQSYFPLPWSFGDRQQRCKEDYGFECICLRCKEESTWSEGEWETDDDVGMEDAAAAGGSHDHHPQHEHQPGGVQEDSPGQQGGVDSAYISLFLLKYVCPHDGCQGTLAPLPPPGPADQYECNMCGRRRTEAEFLAELEAAQ